MFRLIAVCILLGCALAAVIDPLVGGNGRIVGGQPTTITDFPYQVSLLVKGYLCGGSLIADDLVLTAAHCVESADTADQITVRLGSTYYKSGGILVTASAFKYNENYDPSTTNNDVALVLLSTPVSLTNSIQTIPLATAVPSTGTPAVVSGWGTSSFSSNTAQRVLHEVEVQIIDESDCASPKYKYGKEILPSMICAAVDNGGKDACRGDSGGPLVANNVLVGVVSWGNSCALKSYPGVYASVPYFNSWIKNTIAALRG